MAYLRGGHSRRYKKRRLHFTHQPEPEVSLRTRLRMLESEKTKLRLACSLLEAGDEHTTAHASAGRIKKEISSIDKSIAKIKKAMSEPKQVMSWTRAMYPTSSA